MFGSFRHDVTKARELLIILGHESASFLPDEIVTEWMNNYLDRIDKGSLDPNRHFDKLVLDTLTEYMLLVGIDETD